MKSKINSKKGFTIVELLIVIVIIGILAAITLVSYSGISAKANTATSQSAASATISKVSAYYAEKSSWPSTFATLTTSASASETYKLSGVSFIPTANLQTIGSSAPASNSTLLYEVCGTGATTALPGNLAAITTITGIKIDYWKYEGAGSNQSYTVGTTSGLINTYNVACWSSGS